MAHTVSNTTLDIDEIRDDFEEAREGLQGFLASFERAKQDDLHKELYTLLDRADTLAHDLIDALKNAGEQSDRIDRKVAKPTLANATADELLADATAETDNTGQVVIYTGLYEWSDKTLHDHPETDED